MGRGFCCGYRIGHFAGSIGYRYLFGITRCLKFSFCSGEAKSIQSQVWQEGGPAFVLECRWFEGFFEGQNGLDDRFGRHFGFMCGKKSPNICAT